MKRVSFLLAMILVAVTGGAQTARVTGKAVDPSGAVVTGADVTLLGPANTTVATTKSGPDGNFSMDVPPGSYALEISADGFEKVVQGISAAVNGRPMTITLSISGIAQQVAVQDNPNLITLDADNNQTALVLKEEDIESLPDDEDALTDYLTQLAGPRAAAAGGVQFIID